MTPGGSGRPDGPEGAWTKIKRTTDAKFNDRIVQEECCMPRFDDGDLTQVAGDKILELEISASEEELPDKEFF